jgi:hypothetical protein
MIMNNTSDELRELRDDELDAVSGGESCGCDNRDPYRSTSRG